MGKVLQATLFALVFTVLSTAQASWKVQSETGPQGKFCVASTSIKEGKSQYSLQVRVSEDLKTPTEMLIARTGPALAVKGFQGRVGVNGPLLQFSSLSVQGTTEHYLGLPHNLLGGLNAMVVNKELDLQPVGSTGDELDFNLKGYDAAAKDLAKCSQNLPLANQEFETALIGTGAMSVDLARLTPAVTQQLRETAFQAYAVFLQRKANQRALADLRNKYLAEITEHDRLNARINAINGTELPNLSSRRARLVTQLAQAEQELRDTQANLPKTEARVVTARKAFDNASAILDPLIPQHDSLVSQVDLAESNLSNSRARLRQVDSDIISTRQKIRELYDRQNDLRYEINNLRNQLPNAKYALQEADRNLRAFNHSAEVNQYLMTHNHSGLKSQESSLMSQVQSAQQALQQCQATPGANCAAQQMQLNQANAQLRNIQNQIADVERRARKQADDKLDDLQDRQRAAARRVQDIETRIIRAEDEIRDIQSYQIPRFESNLRSLEMERNQLLNTINYQENSLANAERALADYERRVDWHSKKQSVDSTRTELNAATKALNHARLRLQQLPGEITSYKSEINSIDATVAQLNAELTQLHVAANKLKPVIAKYESEKAPLDAIEKRLAAQLAELSRQYLAGLNS